MQLVLFIKLFRLLFSLKWLIFNSKNTLPTFVFTNTELQSGGLKKIFFLIRFFSFYVCLNLFKGFLLQKVSLCLKFNLSNVFCMCICCCQKYFSFKIIWSVYFLSLWVAFLNNFGMIRILLMYLIYVFFFLYGSNTLFKRSRIMCRNLAIMANCQSCRYKGLIDFNNL